MHEISVIIAVRNESNQIAQTLESIARQEGLSCPLEVLVVDGHSSDESVEIANSFRNQLPGLRILSNPRILAAAAWNLGIKEAKSQRICILSGHARLSPWYFQRMLRELDSDRTAVGGRAIPVGNTPRSQLIAQAFASRLGNGGASFMQLGVARPVESVAFGCYWRQAVLDIGGFDENIVRGQDWDLNLRLRKAGHTLWYIPDIDVEYTTRSDFTALWRRQYLAGLWKPYIHRKNGMPFLFRHWIPACFVALLLAELTLSMFHTAGFGLLIGTALIHMSASFLQRVSLKIPWQMSMQFWWAIAVIHCAYGLGFWRGYLGIATARSQMKSS